VNLYAGEWDITLRVGSSAMALHSLYCSSLSIQRHTSKSDIFSPTWVVYTYKVTLWQTNQRMYILFYFLLCETYQNVIKHFQISVMFVISVWNRQSMWLNIRHICVWYACSYSGLRRETIDQSNAVFSSKTGSKCNVSPRILTFCVHFCFASGKIRLRTRRFKAGWFLTLRRKSQAIFKAPIAGRLSIAFRKKISTMFAAGDGSTAYIIFIHHQWRFGVALLTALGASAKLAVRSRLVLWCMTVFGRANHLGI